MTMNQLRARVIASKLHEKWVSDPNDDGSYVLRLSPEETEEFFRDIAQAIEVALD